MASTVVRKASGHTGLDSRNLFDLAHLPWNDHR